MYYLKRFKKKIVDYLFDHPHQKRALDDFYIIIVTLVGALVFSFGFKCFIQPDVSAFSEDFHNQVASGTKVLYSLASCGGSGISQSVLQIFKLLGLDFIRDPFNQYVTNFVCYFLVNVPLLIFGWFKVGKKFSIITLFNVLSVTVIGILLPTGEGSFIAKVAEYVIFDPVARILFAGLCTGFASATAYLLDSTAGGTDIIAYYISEKKSAGVGKFSVIINLFVVTTFTILSCLNGGLVGKEINDITPFQSIEVSTGLIMLLFTFLYMVITSIVVDNINVLNKKLNVQIITKSENLSKIIIANIPHGCTLIEGKGGYTGKNIFIVNVTVRKNEYKKVVKIAKLADPNCFINVLVNEQVFGKFYRKPIK